jgi:hypothetical protein
MLSSGRGKHSGQQVGIGDLVPLDERANSSDVVRFPDGIQTIGLLERNRQFLCEGMVRSDDKVVSS